MKPNRIIQLDEMTIGHIAAGEVVERPAQVVKELIENSLDANSTDITITVERGGFDRLIVEDNGTGIHPEDLPKALDRHATSKLKSKQDLAEINSLGFRGEALASIGMVARLEIASRPPGMEGATIVMEDGVKAELEPIGIPEGTKITVEHIFQNTPARLAFQRRAETETSRIVDVVVSHALAHPETSFHLKSESRTLLNVPSTEEMMDRLYDILGSQANEMLTLKQPSDDEEAPGDERWTGWISTPDITRGKGDDIHILINGRPVAAGPFLQTVRRGYKTRLMQGRHPLAVLNLTCPPAEVDVNVHPTKREVRLRHSWRVLERLERCIAYSLESIPTQPDATGGIPELRGLSGGKEVKSVETYLMAEGDEIDSSEILHEAAGLSETKNRTAPSIRTAPPSWAIAAGEQLDLTGNRAEEAAAKDKPRPVSHSPLGQKLLNTNENKPIAPALSSAERALHRYAGIGEQQSPSREKPLDGVLNELPEMEPLAQFANSYILVQAEGELLLIDQHALHERIRFERLRNAGQSWEAQSRLEGLDLKLDARQSAVVDANQSRLHELGFHLENTGDTWYLTASPQLIEGDDIRPFFLDLLQDISGGDGPLTTIEAKKDHIAFMNACRGAVKANQSLTLPEMRRLLEDMRRIPNPWACVHGRPTSLRIPIDSLDHHFGRHG
ncbi:MAG TPA: DNA mismatch repair endonuclease MutL [Poseidonia sp.]|nr:DNA mismatch repair endonuclease MutL [Poseidonia sp.]